MTLSQLLRALSRRWYLMLAFMLIVVMMAVVSARTAGVYWTRVDVVFLPPASAGSQNTLRAAPEGLVDFAAIVEREYNGNKNPPRFASGEATLVGSGVREGNRVSLVDTGGQWQDSFVRPVLAVEVVGESQRDVQNLLSEAITRIENIAAEQQKDANVPTGALIDTLPSPSYAAIQYAGGSITRAATAILALGLLLSVVATVLIDWLVRQRQQLNPLRER